MTKVLLLLFLSLPAYGEILFEGYYKLSLGESHIGYIIQRFDLDSSTKLFTATHYVLTTSENVTTTESLSAKSDTKLQPVSYQYTRVEGSKTKAIDAIMKKNKLVLKIVENGKASVRETALGDKVFFSAFLAHLMMKTPKGIAVGNKFTYDAVAEEDGTIEKGEAFVKEQVKEKGFDTFRVLNTYKKELFVNWLNLRGESMKTHVPQINLTAELVADPKTATANFPVNESTLKILFGQVPAGKTNMLHTK